MKVQIRNYLQKLFHKKGRSLALLPFFIFIASCSQDLSKQGNVSFYNSADKKSFIFTVSEEFSKDNKNSNPDEYNPKITEAEAALLTKILTQSGYCQNDKEPSFIITSKQEKVYDMTFAHLIEENYNARPIVPKTYFGQCRAK